jgi:hypothetical protein
MEIHHALLTAVHAQPVPAVTATEAVPPPGTIVWLVGEIEKLQEEAKENVLEGALRLMPPGPTAAILASYTMPGDGNDESTLVRRTRITPPAPGVGLPSETD